jgi:hypothetical protein
MEKKGITFYFIVLLILTTSCRSQRADTAITYINIEVNLHNMQKVFLSQYVTNVSYVPLECSFENSLGWQSSNLITISEENILDTDRRICILYDKEGHFLRKIGQIGRGPGEYQGISFIALINDKIYIHDFYTDDMIEYALDGTFIERYNSGFTADSIYRVRDVFMINDSMILGSIENSSGQEKNKAIIFNKEGAILNSYENHTFFKLEPGVKYTMVPGASVMHKFEDKVYFKEFLNDTLFSFDNNLCLTPEYVLNLGKLKEPDSDRGKSWTEIDLLSYIDIDNIFQTKDFLIINCDFNENSPAKRITPEIIKTPSGRDYTRRYNTTSLIGIYHKRTGKLIFSEPTDTDNHLFTSGLYNDFDAGPRFIPGKMVNDSTMVMKIRSDYLIEHIGSVDFKNNIPKYPEKKRRLEEFVDSIKRAGFDNPVYMFVTFKNSESGIQ